jgi:hypothetical protein
VEKPPHAVKGTHVLMAREVVDELLGEGTFLNLANDYGAGWLVLLPSTWYDVHPLNHALVQVAAKLGKTVTQISTEICARNAKKDLTSVYRAFLRVAGPHLVMNATPALWRNYVSFAEAAKVENVKGRFVGLGTKIPTTLLDWACGAWLGFPASAIELSGGKHCKARILERGPDEGSTELSRVLCEVVYD